MKSYFVHPEYDSRPNLTVYNCVILQLQVDYIYLELLEYTFYHSV